MSSKTYNFLIMNLIILISIICIYYIYTFSNFNYINITGAYANIPINAQYSTTPIDALTIYSCPSADMKNTIKFATVLLIPDFKHGKYICPNINIYILLTNQ